MRLVGMIVGVVALAAVAAFVLLGDDGAPSRAALVEPRPVVSAPDVPATAPLIASAVVAQPARLERTTPPRRSRARRPGFLVVDAFTGERIRSGTILSTTRPNWQLGREAREGHTPPAPFDDALVDDAPFPERLVLGSRRHVLWVTAPGYAWTVHTRNDGDVVRLRPAGDLVVDFAPPTSACAEGMVDVTLSRGQRVFTPDEPARVLVLARDAAPLRYTRLPAGRYELEVRAASAYDVGTVLAADTIEVAPHDVTHRHVTLASLPTSTLEVIVTLPAGRELPRGARVDLRAAQTGDHLGYGDPDAWQTRDGRARLVVECLTPGPYRVQSTALALAQPVLLAPADTTTVHVDMTEYATIRADVSGCAFGHVATLSWSFVDAPEVSFVDFVGSHEAVKTWQVPPRPIRIRVSGIDAASEPIVVTPMPGETLDVDVVCDPTATATAVVHYLWSSDAPRPQSTEFQQRCDVAPIGHRGTRTFISQSDHTDAELTAVTYVFDGPGRYELTYPVTWDETDTVEIEAGPGEREPIVIELG